MVLDRISSAGKYLRLASEIGTLDGPFQKRFIRWQDQNLIILKEEESISQLINDGTLLIHLGMSGSLRIVKCYQEFRKHDHIDIKMDSENRFDIMIQALWVYVASFRQHQQSQAFEASGA